MKKFKGTLSLWVYRIESIVFGIATVMFIAAGTSERVSDDIKSNLLILAVITTLWFFKTIEWGSEEKKKIDSAKHKEVSGEKV